MRVCIALVVALVSLLATNSAVLAATASNPNDLVPLTSPELIENRQRESVRFLRKQENAELDSEERGITDIWNYLTRLVSKARSRNTTRTCSGKATVLSRRKAVPTDWKMPWQNYESLASLMICLRGSKLLQRTIRRNGTAR
ncbi:hypothetical protein PI124_g21089 [Phytophthora idaei]|nr:hypothetical protein PI125_g20153 [Phytophthora idaei]KAG3129723.1 hypothetical protein PI126_g20837 [Phytophthora idaei]KAG3233845.1 hypothetical protein PI124_g21089 [Phytophthora idaei]